MNFEEMVRKTGFSVINPEKTEHGDILLAEKWNTKEEMWEMLWAIKRGVEDMGRTVFFKINTPRYIRILATQKDALSFIADNIKAGRYG